MNRRSTAYTALSVAGLGMLVAMAAVATALKLDGPVRIVVTAVLVCAVAGVAALLGASVARSSRE